MDADAVQRNTPEKYERYMRANPLYFEALWRVEFDEENLERAVARLFHGKELQEQIMANKKGICVNCKRGPMTVRPGNLCTTCDRYAGSLTGEARVEKLAFIKKKIELGDVKPRGKNAAALRAPIITIDAPGKKIAPPALRADVEAAARKMMGSGARAPFDRLESMVKELEALGCEVNITLSIGMGSLA
jgi:hypothetical protein